jgi:iron complex outermembrane receptor protein
MRKHFVYLFCFFNICHLVPVCAAEDITIPPVIITANQDEHDSLTSSPKTIITRQEMATTGVTSLTQALQEFGGLQLQDETGTNSQVLLNIRGFGANANSNTLILINGIPITNPDLALPDLNAIPVQEIEYIEIISGSESVLYGDQAVGGTINIVTRQSSNENSEISCSAGSFNQRICYGMFNNHFRQLNYGVGLSGNHTDNYRDNNSYDQTLTSGHLNYSYQIGKIGFDYTITNERMRYPGALTAAEVFQNRRQSENTTDFFKDWNGLYHLKWEQQLNSRWRLETDVSRREMHGSGVLTSPFQQSRVIHFLKPEIKGTLGQAIVINGLDVENDQYHLASLFGTTQNTQKKIGLFGIFRTPIYPRFILSVGARGAEQKSNLQSFTQVDSLNRAIATTVGITFQYNTATQFYLRRAESFRFPKSDENASTLPGVNGLKTQRGTAYEGGITWNWKQLRSHFSIYQLNLKDEIAFDPTQTPSTPFGINRNLDPTVRRGFSLAEKFLATDKITLGGQYHFVRARFDGGIYSGNRIPLVAENILHANINYQISLHWNVYTEAVFTGNEFSDNDNGNTAGKMGGYTVYNLTLRYTYEHFTASLRVNNIFNKYYYFYTVFIPSMQNQFFYPAPGRSFMLTAKYTFL